MILSFQAVSYKKALFGGTLDCGSIEDHNLARDGRKLQAHFGLETSGQVL